MKHRFEWGSGVTRDYLTDRLEITPELDADAYTYLDDTTGQDVRRIRLGVTLAAVFEQTDGTGESATGLWLALLRQEAVEFYPDPQADASLAVSVKLDLSHKHTLMAAQRGTPSAARSLKLKSEWMQPSDSRLDAFADLAPLLTS